VTLTVFVIAAVWLTVLLLVSLVRVITARSMASRVLALDMLILILIALLVVYSDARGVAHLMDAALALALISFVATLAAAHYYGSGRVM
jgi:multicomponent Na+:H+ antiporter subunit F